MNLISPRSSCARRRGVSSPRHAVFITGFAVIILPASSQAAGNVDGARLKAADSEPQN
jgi:hypothetical protein